MLSEIRVTSDFNLKRHFKMFRNAPPPTAENHICEEFRQWSRLENGLDFRQHKGMTYSLFFWDERISRTRYTTCYR